MYSEIGASQFYLGGSLVALYQVDVEKVIGSETWTNVYHVEASDVSAAQTAGNLIVAAERKVHFSSVIFTAMRVRLAGLHHAGTVFTLNLAGTRTSAGLLMPLFNVARLDFANGTARPARKYLRGGLGVSDVGAGYIITGAGLTAFGVYASDILAIAAMRDPQGRSFTGVVLSPLVGMHQLRRGNRRKSII
jgi:hypothetical protein